MTGTIATSGLEKFELFKVNFDYQRIYESLLKQIYCNKKYLDINLLITIPRAYWCRIIFVNDELFLLQAATERVNLANTSFVRAVQSCISIPIELLANRARRTCAQNCFGGDDYQEIMTLGQQHPTQRKETIYQELSQQSGVLQRLTNLLNQQIRDLSGLLQVLTHSVCDAIASAEFCLVLLSNPQTQELELAAAKGIDNKQSGSLKATNTCWGLLSEVFSTGVEHLFQNKVKGEEEKNTESFTNPATIYAVPVESTQGVRLGVLAIGNLENPYAFSSADKNLLNAIREVAAIAIDNALLLKQLQEREQSLAKQNEILLAQNRELEKNRQQTQLQNLQLLEAAQLKSQFLATTSHELRTPLHVILGISQLLLRQRTATLTEQQVDMMQRILSNGNHLLGIIDDMLDFAKMEAGRLSFQVEDINLSKLILTTVAEHRSLAHTKNLELFCDLRLQNSKVVNDSVRLKQVLVKLLLNAIKFTEVGNVTIKAWETENDTIAIAVSDTGIGIASSHLENIFEQFWQADQTTTRKYGGTGMGLAITRSLVEIMQGTIAVTSQVGIGSTFTVELPRWVERQELNENNHHQKVANRIIF